VGAHGQAEVVGLVDVAAAAPSADSVAGHSTHTGAHYEAAAAEEVVECTFPSHNHSVQVVGQ